MCTTSTGTKDDQIDNRFSESMIFHRNPTGNMFVKLLSWTWLRFKLDILGIEGVMNVLVVFWFPPQSVKSDHFVNVLVPT